MPSSNPIGELFGTIPPMRLLRGCVCAGLLALGLAIAVPAAIAQADVIRLSNGNLIEGQILRDDDTAVVMLVNGAPQFFPADDVTAIIYSQLRIAPKSSKGSRVAPGLIGAPQLLMDTSLVQKIRERMLTYHGFMMRIGVVAEHLRWQEWSRAGVAAQRAAQWVLPFHKRVFSPFSALADLLILLGLRAPTLWLTLLLVREPRGFIRIAEFFVLSYGLLMLLMTYVTVTGVLWFQLALFPLAVLAVAWLFMWMFVLTPGRAMLAYFLAIAMNVALEALLVYQGWLSAAGQAASALRLALMK